ncbi:MAG: hypothetical protein ABIH46_05240 [Chloroflexota bacterium]
MTEVARASFELSEEMLGLIGKQFDAQQLARKFAQATSGKRAEEIESIAEEMFARYGVDLIRRSLQLGEEYSDRTYEVLREAIDSTGGGLWFPLLPQRFLEIAYLSTQDMEFLPVIENNPQRLLYRIDGCKVLQALKGECGEEIANMLPCRHACLSACHTLFNDLDYPEVLIEMEASSNKEGYCQFSVKKL